MISLVWVISTLASSSLASELREISVLVKKLRGRTATLSLDLILENSSKSNTQFLTYLYKCKVVARTLQIRCIPWSYNTTLFLYCLYSCCCLVLFLSQNLGAPRIGRNLLQSPKTTFFKKTFSIFIIFSYFRNLDIHI